MSVFDKIEGEKEEVPPQTVIHLGPDIIECPHPIAPGGRIT
jgi:hypothetical protein